MKKIYYLFILLSGIDLNAQDASVHLPDTCKTVYNNYIRSWNVVKPEGNPNNITTSSNLQHSRLVTQYFDGLGRPLQTVAKQGSMITDSSARDLVSPVLYDEYGRVQRSYLPYASPGTDGSFKKKPFNEQSTFYSGSNSPVNNQSETYYYGKTEFEPSPLNRVDRNYALGVWYRQRR